VHLQFFCIFFGLIIFNTPDTYFLLLLDLSSNVLIRREGALSYKVRAFWQPLLVLAYKIFLWPAGKGSLISLLLNHFLGVSWVFHLRCGCAQAHFGRGVWSRVKDILSSRHKALSMDTQRLLTAHNMTSIARACARFLIFSFVWTVFTSPTSPRFTSPYFLCHWWKWSLFYAA
jgi:hypothetical protein